MSSQATDLLQFLAERGHNPTCTDADGLAREIKKGVVTGYIGFDPTADSLHIGNMAQLMLLRRLQMAGHKPIVLMGGATGKVGDPSGRDESRQLLTFDQIKANITSQKKGVERLIKFGAGPTDALLLDNADWLDGIGYIDMLRIVGPHFTINRMLSMDSVKLRLEREQPLTFLEFNYMIMQGYDFVHLREHYNCILQMGGSDQWGNIVQGIELGRRWKGYELFGITQPLVTTSSGAKMGKSVGGAVWINADRKSPYDFWQYWRNCEDADVGRWLRLFTDLPLDEVARLEALRDREINDAKKVLATEVTALVHGREAADAAAKTAQDAFEKGTLGGDIPVSPMPGPVGQTGIIDVVVSVGFAASRGEARKLIQGGGIRINDEKVADPQMLITDALFKSGEFKLSKGGKAIVRVTAA
jgi:tyrosyl-tRNA synthetase